VHFGATLRLLRLESGLGLRDLARRLNVSGAYLSRVENGLDSIPTSARAEAIAGALQIPAPLLLELAHRVSPLVVDYVDAVPEAGSLLLEIEHREPGAARALRLTRSRAQAARLLREPAGDLLQRLDDSRRQSAMTAALPVVACPRFIKTNGPTRRSTPYSPLVSARAITGFVRSSRSSFCRAIR